MAFQEVFDVVVVGGGLMGVAVARDCAMRRLSVLLVERDDIGGGATEILSPLVDGGNRLWANRSNPALLQEFDILERLAPHLFSDCRVLVPAIPSVAHASLRRLQSAASSYQKGAPANRDRRVFAWSAEDFKKRFPRAVGFGAGGIEYSQTLWDPVRFAMATARGARQASARLLLKTAVEEVGTENGRVVGVRLRAAGSRSEFAFAKTVVVAAGVAASRIKGVPLTVPPLQQETVLLLAEKFPAALTLLRETQPTFFIPWRNQTWVGPWVDDFAGSPFENTTNANRSQLIGRNVLSLPEFSPRLKASQTVSRVHFAERQGGGYAEPKLMDFSPNGVKGLFVIEGGNAGFCRAVAERVTTQISESLRLKEECRTAFESLPGGSHEIPWEEEAARTGFPPSVVLGLIRRHGYHATSIFERALENVELARTICECEGVIAAELEFCVKEEWATDLASIARRTGLGTGNCAGSRCLLNAAHLLKRIFSNDGESYFREAATWTMARNAYSLPLAQGWLAAQLELDRYREGRV